MKNEMNILVSDIPEGIIRLVMDDQKVAMLYQKK